MKLYNPILDFSFLNVTGFSFVFFSLFSLLSKKHNKVLEQATQSLRGSLSSSDVPLPDYVSSCLIVVINFSVLLELWVTVLLFSQSLTVLLETLKTCHGYYKMVEENQPSQ